MPQQESTTLSDIIFGEQGIEGSLEHKISDKTMMKAGAYIFGSILAAIIIGLIIWRLIK